MSRSGFDSSRVLDVFRFSTRYHRLDEERVWFQPLGTSWQWTLPAISMDAAGRLPRAGGPPLAFPPGTVWGLRPLMMPDPGSEARDLERLIEEARRREAPGLELSLGGPDPIARVAPLGLKLLAASARGEVDPETWRRLGDLGTLTHLILSAPVGPEVLEAVARLADLRVLVLYGVALGDEDVRRLKPLSRLETLVLPDATLGDRGLEALAGMPLRTLVLSGTTSAGKGVEALAGGGTLRDLEIGFAGLPEAAVPALARLRTLEYLELNGQSWQDGRAASALGALAGLKALGLSWTPVDGLEWLDGLGSLRRLSLQQSPFRRAAAGIERAAGLRELSLPDAEVDDEMLKPVGRLASLRALDLKSARLSGRGLGYLEGLPRLTHLNLFNCVSITDEGVDALVRLPALEELNLGSCSFAYEREQTMGLTDAAAAGLGRLRTLRRLGLAGNHVRPATVAALRRELPDCLVESGALVLSDVVAACEEGEAALADGDSGAALAAFGRALDAEPGFPAALLGRAKALEKQGDLEGALEAADRAVEADREAESYQVRGMIRARAGRSAEAIEDFTCGLKVDPRRAELLVWRAEARLDLKDHAGAVRDFTAWVERCSGPEPQEKSWVGWLAHVLVNRGYARLEAGDAAGAEADSSLMIELCPGDVNALLNRAEARAKMGRAADALADLESVLRIEPGHPDVARLRAELGL